MDFECAFTNEAIGVRAEELVRSATLEPDIINLYNDTLDHDYKTGIHSLGVARMAGFFAIGLNLDKKHAINIVQTSLVHDYAKKYISLDILNKTSSLTPAEMSKILPHPEIGFVISSKIVGAKNALPILLHHSLQSKNYPDKKTIAKLLRIHDLSEKDIDEETLISLACLVVADNFEARMPFVDSSHPYVNRDYSISDLKDKIKFDYLVKAGFLEKLGLVKVFNYIVDAGEHVANQSVKLLYAAKKDNK